MDDHPDPPQSFGDRILASLAAGVLVVDARSRVIHANAAARSLLGVPASANSAGLDGTPLREVVAAGAGLGQGGWKELGVVVAGRPRRIGIQASPMGKEGAADGEPAGVVLTVIDLTAARAAEAATRRAAAVAGIGRLTHHVAHELKNPLGALKLYTLLLGRHLRDAKPDSQELAQKIGRAIEHLTFVVADVATVGPAGSLERGRVAVGPLLDECVAGVAERAAHEGVEVVRRDEPGLAVRGDARALRQAVRAFVDNALDAMAGAGTLTVSATRAGEGTVGIVVEDTGPGLSAEAQTRLFEPFFTTKADKAGLGTAIASHLVEAHGGRIEVRSEPNAGTTIRIALPAD